MQSDIQSLQEELEHFHEEKEKVRNAIGQIGGSTTSKSDRIMTITFSVVIFILFLLDILRHLIGWEIPLPPLFSLALGVLLVSAKIIWMMYRQAKVNHFEFWILNSIEFRLNDISKRIKTIENVIKKEETR